MFRCLKIGAVGSCSDRCGQQLPWALTVPPGQEAACSAAAPLRWLRRVAGVPHLLYQPREVGTGIFRSADEEETVSPMWAAGLCTLGPVRPAPPAGPPWGGRGGRHTFLEGQHPPSPVVPYQPYHPGSFVGLASGCLVLCWGLLSGPHLDFCTHTQGQSSVSLNISYLRCIVQFIEFSLDQFIFPSTLIL